MEQNKKTVSTSTVLITIAFLAMFIILPPVTRILYAEEEEEIVDQSTVEEIEKTPMVIADDYTIICTKLYPTTQLSISSISIYK